MNKWEIVVLVDLDDNAERTELIVGVPKEYSEFSLNTMIQRAIKVVKNCEDGTGLTVEEIKWIEENEFGRDDGFCAAFIWYLENKYGFECKVSNKKLKNPFCIVLF